MTSLTTDTPRYDPRWIYTADGPISATMAVVLILAAEKLTALAGWSLPPTFLVCVGVFLIPWAVFNFAIGRMRHPRPLAVWSNIAGDGAWALASLALLILHAADLTPWGFVLLAGQMAFVTSVFLIKRAGMRRLLG